MIEQQQRGGLCYVGSNRHVKAQNKYLSDYDPNAESNHIMYLDANNLYGWATSQSLPYRNLQIEKSFENVIRLLAFELGLISKTEALFHS